MIDSSSEMLKSLIDFGLTPTEAIVYCTTVSLGGGSTKEISYAAGKERAQTHHALLRLQQLGIVETTVGVPVKFKPVGIREAVDHLYSLQSMKLQRLKGLRTKLVEDFKSSKSGTMMPIETYSIVKGRGNTYLKMIDAIQSSTQEVWLVMSIKGLTRLRRFRNFHRIMESKARRGVQFKVISEVTPENLQDARSLSKIAELRHVRNQITNASLYDDKIGSVALSVSEDLSPDAKDHIALWTTTQSFISTLRNFFDSIWFVAEPVENTMKSMLTTSS